MADRVLANPVCAGRVRDRHIVKYILTTASVKDWLTAAWVGCFPDSPGPHTSAAGTPLSSPRHTTRERPWFELEAGCQRSEHPAHLRMVPSGRSGPGPGPSAHL